MRERESGGEREGERKRFPERKRRLKGGREREKKHKGRASVGSEAKTNNGNNDNSSSRRKKEVEKAEKTPIEVKASKKRILKREGRGGPTGKRNKERERKRVKTRGRGKKQKNAQEELVNVKEMYALAGRSALHVLCTQRGSSVSFCVTLLRSRTG